MQRTRPCHRACHQHLRCALVTEIAIGEAHAGHRTAEAALVPLVEVETGLEGKALDRGTYSLAADLQRVAGQANVADRTRATELNRTSGAEIIEDAGGAAGAVEARECEDLAGNEPARLVGIHHSSQCGHDQRTGRNGAQHQTRKHAATPTYRARATA